MKFKERFYSTILVAIFSLHFTARAQVASGGPFTLDQSVVAGGGGTTSLGGRFSVEGTVGQPAAGKRSTGGPYMAFHGFWTPAALAPTAARVNVGGQVYGALSNRLAYTVVSLLDVSDGGIMTTLTDTRGRFTFGKVEVGKFYVVSVQRKGFAFTPESIGLNLTDDIDDLIFNAIPEE